MSLQNLFTSTEYAIFTQVTTDGVTKTIEKDIDNTMYLHVEFPNCNGVVWKMMLAQTHECFKLLGTVYETPTETDMEFATENGKGFDLILAYEKQHNQTIFIARVPYSKQVAHLFTKWNPSQARCAKELREIIHTAAAALSINQTYTPGTLLGEY